MTNGPETPETWTWPWVAAGLLAFVAVLVYAVLLFAGIILPV